mmetsp:Transcript_110730/g.323962  ORF Transcript_110730/g.323962 Transcript_110730/m.323962 type:complete len:138 (+) Transcript_110730:123-536(+)
MAHMVVTFGLLSTATSLACLVLAQALAPAMSSVPEMSSKVIADKNFSMAVDFQGVLKLKELSGLLPLNSTPAADAEAHLAVAAEELVDVFPARATPEDKSSGAQQQSRPHRRAGRAAEAHLGQPSARDLLRAWDSLA